MVYAVYRFWNDWEIGRQEEWKITGFLSSLFIVVYIHIYTDCL